MILIALAAAAAVTPPFLTDRTPAERPSVMILGSPHLGNPGLDISNTKVENVLAPERQREIAAMVASIASWKPTRVAIEWDAAEQAKLDERYAEYRAGKFRDRADETYQIAFRLADSLGLDHIDAIDWNGEPPGPDSAYAFDEWANANGQDARWTAFKARGQATADASSARMRCTNVSAWYRALNTPAARIESNRLYYDIASFGGGDAAPGANWVGQWYARNLRIFGNLVRIARPRDRVFVLYGAGHGYHLDTFARESGAFRAIDPLRYLPPAKVKPGCK